MVSGHFFDLLGAHPALGRTLRPEDDRPGAEPVLVLSDPLWRGAFGGRPDARRPPSPARRRRPHRGRRDAARLRLPPHGRLLARRRAGGGLARRESHHRLPHRHRPARPRAPHRPPPRPTCRAWRTSGAARRPAARPALRRDPHPAHRAAHRPHRGPCSSPSSGPPSSCSRSPASTSPACSSPRRPGAAASWRCSPPSAPRAAGWSASSCWRASCSVSPAAGSASSSPRPGPDRRPAVVPPELFQAGSGPGGRRGALFARPRRGPRLPRLRPRAGDGLRARTDLHGALREGGRGSAGRGGRRLLRALVVGETAVAMVLLVGAGLLLHALLRLRAVDPGPDPERTLTVQVFSADPALCATQPVRTPCSIGWWSAPRRSLASRPRPAC